jgi:hypothetical protein
LSQESGFDERVDDRVAGGFVEAPQTPDLTAREMKTWNFEIFAANQLQPAHDAGVAHDLASGFGPMEYGTLENGLARHLTPPKSR